MGKQFCEKERYIIGNENGSLTELRGLMLSRLIDFSLSNNDTLRNEMTNNSCLFCLLS